MIMYTAIVAALLSTTEPKPVATWEATIKNFFTQKTDKYVFSSEKEWSLMGGTCAVKPRQIPNEPRAYAAEIVCKWKVPERRHISTLSSVCDASKKLPLKGSGRLFFVTSTEGYSIDIRCI